MDTDPILQAAVRAYLDKPPPAEHDPRRSWSVGSTLDRLIGMVDRWEEHDLAGCLLILALARRQQGGLDCCLAALKHAAAQLDLFIPLGQPGGPEAARLAADTETEITPHHIYTERN